MSLHWTAHRKWLRVIILAAVLAAGAVAFAASQAASARPGRP